MNKYFFLSGILILIHLLVSCTDDREQFSSGNAVSFVPSIKGNAVATRASENSWEDNDRVGIYMVPHVADPSAAADFSIYTHHNNLQYKTPNSGVSVPLTAVGDAIIYPAGDVDVNFVAYYPYRSTLHSTENDIYPIDVAIQSPTKDIDFLYHKGTGTPYRGKTASNVGLEFEHQLSRWIICVEPASAGVTVDLSTATASISGFPSTASFNLSTGVMSNQGGTDAVLTPVKDTDNSSIDKATFVALLVPHADGASYTRTLSVVIEGYTYEYAVPANHSFEPGVSNVYNLKFTGSKLLLLEKTIVDWQGGAVAWNDDLLIINKTNFKLFGGVTNGSTIKISTSSTDPLKVFLSNEKNSISIAKPDWITTNLSVGLVGSDGWITYELAFDVQSNPNHTERTGYIHLETNGLTIVVNVHQESIVIYVDDPTPAIFEIEAFDDGVKTFTIITNSLDEDCSIMPNPPDWMNITAPSRHYESDTGISTWTVTFNVLQYEGLKNDRTYNIYVKINDFQKKIQITQKKLIFPIVDNLANCYMAVPGGNVTIPIERAITVGGMDPDASFTIEKIWDDNNVYNDCVISGVGRDREIMVTTNNASGNALIALKSEGIIYWSWHLWVSDYDCSTTWNNEGFVFMDRNLGAIAAENSLDGRGLFYQWGRKDPSPGSGTAGSGVEVKLGPRPPQGIGSELMEVLNVIQYTIQNPDIFITSSNGCWAWSYNNMHYFWINEDKKKTVYDPCPSGWRIPMYNTSKLPWGGATSPGYTQNTDEAGVNFGENALFPAAGYRFDKDGKLTSHGVFGYYWIVNDVYKVTGQMFRFNFNGRTYYSSDHVAYGYPVRYIKE